ncbi:MAG: sigma-70 family RNA polymerase sigma factor [Betaproteobacteria bacterium]|nr:sigma-70 family RNA polymerase sigma factor [Betaproteobacteria bacterium]
MLTDVAIGEQIPSLRRYARALTGNRDAADDLVQDTLERALSRSALFRPGGNPRAWLFAIMHNVFVNQVRSAASRRTVSLDPDSMEAAGQDLAHQGLAVRDIERALALLPAEQREVVLLVALETLSYADTAKVVGVPVGTVMSRLSRGRERLRGLINGASETAPLKVIK